MGDTGSDIKRPVSVRAQNNAIMKMVRDWQ